MIDKKPKTFTIVTFGCRTNQAESRMIGEQLSKLAMKQCSNETIADLVIINSCAVTCKAEREVKQYIRRVKRENPSCYLILTGCFDEKSGFKIYDLRIKNKKNIAKIIKKKFSNNDCKSYQDYKDKYLRSGKGMVKIQDGCNNFCSYCIVPYLRGRSVSRSHQEIIKEIQTLENKEITEIILTGVDIADYQDLTGLLKNILNKTKIEKISFGSINIEAFNPELVDLIKKNSRITRHFHIPLQSGCEQTLKRMKRKYTVSNFVFRISNLKKKIPEFTFSTDIIVGFPGETDKEFDESLRSLKSLKSLITKLHVFRYSPRSGTVAAKMEKKWGEVPEEIKKQRWQQIKSLSIDI